MKVDKRTKKYKESIKNKRPVLLGDVIDNVTTKTGVKKIVKKLFGDDCGCDERKQKLNANYDFTRNKYVVRRCMTEQQYNDYKEYREVRSLKWTREQIQFLIDLFAHVFAIPYQQSDFCVNCSGSAKRLKTMDEKLEDVYNSYEGL